MRLVIDTCLAACQVGLFEGARLIAGASEPMERGHQERLAPMAAEVMAGRDFSDLSGIAATVGPGSFTGLRVGLAFAKGLRFATGAPLVGLGTLEALAASAGGEGPAAGVIDARRGLVYVQAFEGGSALFEPDVLSLEDAAARLAGLLGLRLVGPGAHLLKPELPDAELLAVSAPDLAAIGRLADDAPASDDVRPIYLRAPDAKLPAAALPA